MTTPKTPRPARASRPRRPAAPSRSGTGTTRARARKAARPSGPPPTAPDPVEIALRAYFLYLERGGDGDHALDDWLTAERELGG